MSRNLLNVIRKSKVSVLLIKNCGVVNRFVLISEHLYQFF